MTDNDERSGYWQKVEKELQERIKELECLYSIGSEIESDLALSHILQKSVFHLQRSFQYPEEAIATIFFDGQEYSNRSPAATALAVKLEHDITVNRKLRGTISVGYLREAELLPEEKRLIAQIANMLAKAVEKHELRAELTRYVGKLEELVRERTAELERTKKLYADLFDYAPDGLAISRVNGDIIKANKAFFRMLQYPEDGSVSLNYVSDRLYENQAELRPRILAKLSADGRYDGLEMTLLNRHGLPCPVLASFIFIEMDNEQCVEAIYKDIQFRKELENRLIQQNENLEAIVQARTDDLLKQKGLLEKKNEELLAVAEELRRSQAELKTLFDAITDTVVLVDPDGHVQMSNRADITAAASCHEQLFKSPDRCSDCPVEKVFREKKAVSVEKKVGSDYYLLRAYPVMDADQQVKSVLAFYRPITKEKNMELQLLQSDKLASLGQLVSGVAHEINNPNTFIRGNIQIVQEAMADIIPITDRHHQENPQLRIARLPYEIFRRNIMVLLDDMAQGASRIKTIVEGLRNFARKDDGALKNDIDVNQVIESSLRLVGNQIRRNASVKATLQPDLPLVHGNSQKLQQVLINMLINASQAIDKKRGHILVSSARVGDEIQLQIQDNGRGMDENTRKMIFDPFFTTKRGQGGTGLGLSIAYGILQEHKGRIEVESKLHHGTTFTIFLPLPAGEKK